MSNRLENVTDIKQHLAELKSVFSHSGYADYISQQMHGIMRLNMNALRGKSWRKLSYSRDNFIFYYEYQKIDMRNRGQHVAKLKSKAYKYSATQIVAEGEAYDAVLEYLEYIENNVFYIDALKFEPSYEKVHLHRQNQEDRSVPTWEFVDVRELAAQCSIEMYYIKSRIYRLHNLHISTDVPTQVAYYPSLRNWREDRPVRTTIGKYLTKYKDIFDLNEVQIKSIAERHLAKINARAGWTVKYIEHDDRQGWLNVYGSKSVRSCMRGMEAVRVYAHEKSVLRLAYLQDGAGDIIGRCIVRDDDTKGWLRAYPDPNGSTEGRFLLDSIRAAGYVDNINLDGVLLDCIEEGNAYVCPYIDGGDEGDQTVDVVYIDGKHYLRVGNGDYDATNTNGYVGERHHCDCCGEACDEDDLTYIDSDERSVCEYCRDRNYTYAYGRRYQEYFPDNDCVEVNGTWFLEATINEHDIYMCEVRDEYYHQDDLYFFDEGTIHVDEAVHVDHAHDGMDYIHPNYVHTLSDGTTCHDDDADEYQAEIDEADEDTRTDVQMSEQFAVAG